MILRMALLVSIFLAATALPVYADLPMYTPTAETDSMLVLVEIRPLAEIEHDLEDFATLRAAAEVNVSRAEMLQARSLTMIKIKEAELTSLKAEIDNAKMRKDEVQKSELENRKKLADREAGLLKRRDELRKSEIEFAQAEVEYYSAEVKSLENELQLAHLRGQRLGLKGSVESKEVYEVADDLGKKIGELEGETLDARIKAAEKQKTLADKAIQITKDQKRIYEARRKVIETATNP